MRKIELEVRQLVGYSETESGDQVTKLGSAKIGNKEVASSSAELAAANTPKK